MKTTSLREQELRQILVDYKVSTEGESMGLDQAVKRINTLFEQRMEEIYEDWEDAIRFAWNDEEGTVLDRKVMDTHLEMSKDARLQKLHQEVK